MRLRHRAGIAIGCVALGMAASPAAAPAKDSGRWRAFKAKEAGVSELRPVGGGLYEATGDAFISGRLIGNGSLHLETVLAPGPNGTWAARGHFKITAQDGDSFRGTTTGTAKLSGQVNLVLFHSRITGGTGRFAGARGRLVSPGTSTLKSLDVATGVVRTVDSAVCRGRIRLASRGG
jgi:hypothetical protein